jgi:hypothetical protein
MLLPETLLDRVKLPVGRQALNRRDFLPVHLHGEKHARLDGLTVEQNGASATNARLATDMSACQAEDIAKVMHEEQARFYLVGVTPPVHRHRDAHHPSPPKATLTRQIAPKL